MSQPRLTIRPMQESDLAQVLTIEEAAFPGDPWPRSVFHRQLGNTMAHFIVLAQIDSPARAAMSDSPGKVLAYAGAWIIVDEAHLMNIAVAPSLQGQGLGELLLLDLLERVRGKGAVTWTLEVRPSNIRAQRLYKRLGFDVAGRRKHYYVDDGEDALIMTTDALATLQPLHRQRFETVCLRLSSTYDLGGLSIRRR